MTGVLQQEGQAGGHVTHYVKDQLECMELCLGMDEELAKSLWCKGKTELGEITVAGCSRPPDREEQMDVTPTQTVMKHL